MNKQWQAYQDKYLQLTIREQYLILATGLVAIFFILLHLFVDPIMVANQKAQTKIQRLTTSNNALKVSVADLELALQTDPNAQTRKKIAQFEAKLAKVDAKLLALTSDLINPIQMRHALLDLLKLEKGVSLLSFELLGAQPLLALQSKSQDETAGQVTGSKQVHSSTQEASTEQNLYRHGIKLKLSGGYFQLQAYLKRLEQLSWRFFWQDFNFTLTEYPKSELEIIIYSLSTKKEFVGV